MWLNRRFKKKCWYYKVNCMLEFSYWFYTIFVISFFSRNSIQTRYIDHINCTHICDMVYAELGLLMNLSADNSSNLQVLYAKYLYLSRGLIFIVIKRSGEGIVIFSGMQMKSPKELREYFNNVTAKWNIIEKCKCFHVFKIVATEKAWALVFLFHFICA